MTASIDTDLPEPDSPTIASTSRSSTCSETPLTARNGPDAVWNSTTRFSISKQRHHDLLELRVERVAQAVADQIDGEHGDQDGEARKGHHPPGAAG